MGTHWKGLQGHPKFPDITVVLIPGCPIESCKTVENSQLMIIYRSFFENFYHKGLRLLQWLQWQVSLDCWLSLLCLPSHLSTYLLKAKYTTVCLLMAAKQVRPVICCHSVNKQYLYTQQLQGHSTKTVDW